MQASYLLKVKWMLSGKVVLPISDLDVWPSAGQEDSSTMFRFA